MHSCSLLNRYKIFIWIQSFLFRPECTTLLSHIWLFSHRIPVDNRPSTGQLLPAATVENKYEIPRVYETQSPSAEIFESEWADGNEIRRHQSTWNDLFHCARLHWLGRSSMGEENDECFAWYRRFRQIVGRGDRLGRWIQSTVHTSSGQYSVGWCYHRPRDVYDQRTIEYETFG